MHQDGLARATRAVLALGLALRCAIASRDLDTVDRLFVPDDTYYVLAIARSMADGLGPTANGETLTNGFQPLIAFFLVPVLALLDGTTAPLRALLYGLSAVDVAVAAVLGLLARRLAGPVAGLAATALWCASPVAIDIALGGLETPLALLCLVGLTELWCRARAAPSARNWTAVGLVAGLALLARVDTVFLVGMLGAVELAGRNRWLPLVIGASVVVVAPWWGYSILTFGTPIPDSGQAARAIALAYQRDLLTVPGTLSWASMTLVGPPFAELEFPRRFVYVLAPWLGPVLVGGGLLAAGGTARQIARTAAPADRAPLIALVAHGALIVMFYALYVPVLWFFRRYLSPAMLVEVLVIAVLVSRAAQGSRPLSAVLALCGLVGAGLSLSRLWIDPPLGPTSGLNGPTGYAAPTAELLAELPDGAVVAGLQSGALSWLAPPGVTVHNLDGVVDAEASDAFVAGELDRILVDRGVTHFLDWDLQHRMLVERSVRPVTLHTVHQTSIEQQNHSQLRLSTVTVED
ncbi:MAG: hypothetical protein ACI9K2_001671 [Myxococcota bacterium]|jgi:hypothetical protein